MATRIGFGDETWRLALAGDREGLLRVADLLAGPDGSPDYDGHRARAFAWALDGDVETALVELNEGWTEEWPLPSAYAADVARVHFLGRDERHALEALLLAARSAEVLDPAVPELAVACAGRGSGLRRAALQVAVAAGTPWQRARTAVAVLRAPYASGTSKPRLAR